VVALKAVLLAVADRRMAWTVVSFSFFTVFSLTLFSSASPFFFCFSRCSSLSRWFCCCLAALMVLVAMERTLDDSSCFLLLLPLLLARQTQVVLL
jgi:hypothetical protein